MTNRPLTPEELDLAPEWATHYVVCDDGTVLYEDKDGYWCVGMKEKESVSIPFVSENATRIPKSIPTEPFDIESVEWSDVSNIKRVIVYADGDLRSELCNMNDDYYETKQDIINKCKALGITAEDLK